MEIRTVGGDTKLTEELSAKQKAQSEIKIKIADWFDERLLPISNFVQYVNNFGDVTNDVLYTGKGIYLRQEKSIP